MRGCLKNSSYQFISEFDVFRHKFHCHKRFNILRLFKYLICLIFKNFRVGVGGGIYSRKVKLSQIFIQNLFDVIRYLMPPWRDRVKNVSDENVLCFARGSQTTLYKGESCSSYFFEFF